MKDNIGNNGWIKVFAPATVANVGPGFDILGFALERPGDIVKIRKIPQKKVILSKVTGDKGQLPVDVQKNVAGLAAYLIWKKLKPDHGLELQLQKGMPQGSGIGSSGASAAAGVFATNLLLGEKLTKEALLRICAECEKRVDGGWHLDNAGTALIGGFMLYRSYDPLDAISLPVPKNLYCAIVLPEFQLFTAKARSVVPKEVPLTKVIRQTGNIAAFVSALYEENFIQLGKAVEDCIIEPARSSLIPAFEDVKQAAYAQGAYGCSISGAGPAIFAFGEGKNHALLIGLAMQYAWKSHKMKSEIIISRVGAKGARIVT